MLYLVIKHVNGRDQAVSHDGTLQPDVELAEQYLTAAEANVISAKFGGSVVSDQDIFSPAELYGMDDD